jgi:hypothetical protein
VSLCNRDQCKALHVPGVGFRRTRGVGLLVFPVLLNLLHVLLAVLHVQDMALVPRLLVSFSGVMKEVMKGVPVLSVDDQERTPCWPCGGRAPASKQSLLHLIPVTRMLG